MHHDVSITRKLSLRPVLERRSCFLFGPRQTGKSWMIRDQFAGCKVYNLLNSSTFITLSQSPARIRQELGPGDRIVVIDEIQKLPTLLDEVQLMIEEQGVTFLLTGSSARKLRRGGVNLLGGRARVRHLHPFIRDELGDRFDLLRALDIGLLPSIYLSDEPYTDLASYAGVYLREEIAAEAVVRNVPAFSRFLTVAALCHGQIVNQSNVAADAQVSRTTVHEYYEILRDTLMGFELPAWKKTIKRKPFSTSKFYLFDSGVARSLQHRKGLQFGATECGEAFETYIFHEIRAYLDYTDAEADVAYWRSTSGFEVDFVLGDATAIEVKAKANVAGHDLKGLRALKEETTLKHYIVVSLEDSPRVVDDIKIWPWEVFLQALWEGELL
ncbi:MAG: AAA family ATPase [Chitinivibrionales bacterium]|nr:AAA family ATPase [Chitinivibrionales bacterium]